MSELKAMAEQAIRAAARTHRGIVYRDYGPEAEWVLSTIEPHIRADERAKVLDQMTAIVRKRYEAGDRFDLDIIEAWLREGLREGLTA